MHQHAYEHQFNDDREAYLDAFHRVIDWVAVGERLHAALDTARPSTDSLVERGGGFNSDTEDDYWDPRGSSANAEHLLPDLEGISLPFSPPTPCSKEKDAAWPVQGLLHGRVNKRPVLPLICSHSLEESGGGEKRSVTVPFLLDTSSKYTFISPEVEDVGGGPTPIHSRSSRHCGARKEIVWS